MICEQNEKTNRIIRVAVRTERAQQAPRRVPLAGQATWSEAEALFVWKLSVAKRLVDCRRSQRPPYHVHRGCSCHQTLRFRSILKLASYAISSLPNFNDIAVFSPRSAPAI